MKRGTQRGVDESARATAKLDASPEKPKDAMLQRFVIGGALAVVLLWSAAAIVSTLISSESLGPKRFGQLFGQQFAVRDHLTVLGSLAAVVLNLKAWESFVTAALARSGGRLRAFLRLLELLFLKTVAIGFFVLLFVLGSEREIVLFTGVLVSFLLAGALLSAGRPRTG